MTRTDGNIMKYRDKFAKVPLHLIDDFRHAKRDGVNSERGGTLFTCNLGT
jgi:hypothetical protein